MFALETAYVRSEEDDEFLRGEFLLQDFPRDTGGIHLTSREFVSIDPCKHFTTLDREQLLTAHHLGWLLIDTESIFGIPLIRFEGKSIHAERGGRQKKR